MFFIYHIIGNILNSGWNIYRYDNVCVFISRLKWPGILYIIIDGHLEYNNNSHLSVFIFFLTNSNVNKRVRSMKRSNSVSVSSTDTSPDESYIIKLLGRRVNLTTFDVDVPIYALCRSWIQDDPDAQMRYISVL